MILATNSDPLSAPNPWRAVIRRALCETPGLVWVFPQAAAPGYTLWRTTRAWVDCLRGLDIAPGDRLVLSGAPDLGWMGAILAGLWLEATLVLLPAGVDPTEVGHLDARLVIGAGGHVTSDAQGLPFVRTLVRSRHGLIRREVRFILRTSGTGGATRWIALSDSNVLAVLDSHLALLGLNSTHRLLSVLPWHHAFGLVLEFLAALRTGSSLVRCAAPADAAEQVRLARRWKLDWWCAVPAMVRRLAAEPGGNAVLAGLRGGIVGGAALTADTCALLADTPMRVGYGQTEASPGIMLGAPGEFAPNLIGRPVGCAVRLSDDGGIEFSGPNACLGPWPLPAMSDSGKLPQVWVETGDLARLEGDAYFFSGRRDDLLRLDNGRTVSAFACENRIKDRCPAVGQLMLWSPDGQVLALAFTGITPGATELADSLGALAARVRAQLRVPVEGWHWTAKGETDRVALRRTLLRAHGQPGPTG